MCKKLLFSTFFWGGDSAGVVVSYMTTVMQICNSQAACECYSHPRPHPFIFVFIFLEVLYRFQQKNSLLPCK